MDLDKNLVSSETIEYQNKIINKYPVLNNNIRIHHWPDNRKIITGGKAAMARNFKNFEENKATEITDDGYLLLKLADGTRSINDIIDYICSKNNLGKIDVETKISRFYSRANKEYEHVRLLDFPSETSYIITETGSKDNYFPLSFSIELTNRCNMNCKHCYRLHNNYEKYDLPYKDIVYIIDEMYSMGATVIELTGGEISLHPNFLDVVEYASEKMEQVGLLSNGYALHNSIIDKIARLKNKDKIVWSISLHSYDPTFYDSFVGKLGAHKKVCNSIKNLVDSDFLVRTAMSVIEENFDHIKDTMDFCHDELHPAVFHYAPIVPLGRASTTGIVTCSRLPEEWNEINEYGRKKYGRFLFNAREFRPEVKKDENCGAGWRSCVFGPDGSIRACLMMDEKQYKMGDIYERKIVDNFNENGWSMFYKQIPKPDPDFCEEGCPDLYFCWGCIYRGMLTNYERIKQGKDICNWAKKSNISFDKIGNLDVSPCYNKTCSFLT